MQFSEPTRKRRRVWFTAPAFILSTALLGGCVGAIISLVLR